MKKKYAFILMGANYKPEVHNACFETEKQITSIITVHDFEEAQLVIQKLKEDGYGAVELCGAFREEKAKKIIELTDNEMAVGYVTGFKEQEPLFKKFWGK